MTLVTCRNFNKTRINLQDVIGITVNIWLKMFGKLTNGIKSYGSKYMLDIATLVLVKVEDITCVANMSSWMTNTC